MNICARNIKRFKDRQQKSNWRKLWLKYVFRRIRLILDIFKDHRIILLFQL
jgi:hypothetical protein